MNLRFLAAATAAIIAVGAAPAHAQLSLSVAGGINLPVGSLGDAADEGYNAAVAVNVGAPLLPVALKFEGAYNGLQLKRDGGDVRIISGTANAVFNIGRASDAPYLIAGLGAYNRRLTLNPFGLTSDETVVGINAGGGLRFPLGGLTTFFEARYHAMLGGSSDATNYQFIPITFGIVF
jgi:hypothetical protein